mgnify:CR=1 FL=1
MYTLAFIGLSIVSCFIVISFYHYRRVKVYLFKEIPIGKQMTEDAKAFFGVESLAVTGVSLFDVLFNTARLDTYVLKGIDHLHYKQEFSDLGELTSYIKTSIINKAEPGSEDWKEIIDKYKGYTGEELAFDHLRDSGANVIVPQSGTNRGIDAITDGEPIDVAITTDVSYIKTKLKSKQDDYTDTKIYTNKEMSPYFDDNPRVIIDSELSEPVVFSLTDSTFDGISDIGTYCDAIPLMTLAIVGFKNTTKVINNEKDVRTAIEHTGLDALGVGAGGLAGTKIGLALGLAFSPVTGGASAIIIPAASTLIGTLLGIITGKSVTNWFKQRHLRKATNIFLEEAINYRTVFLCKYETLLTGFNEYFNKNIINTIRLKKQLQNWFMRTFFPSVLVMYCSLSLNKIKTEHQNTLEYYSELKRQIEDSDPVEGGIFLFNQGEDIILGDKELLGFYDKVKHAYMRVREEQMKL